MLKIKSKAILAFTGLMLAAAMIFSATPASADMVTLQASGTYKSSGITNVQALQTFLNWTLGAQITPLVVDGVYGAKTTTAVKLFQSLNGLNPDGVFGPISTAKAMALQANAGGVVYPAGCASNAGYSSTTGLPCSSGASWPAGCTSNMGFSSTTGVPCNSGAGVVLPAGCATASGYSVTTGVPCSNTSVQSGTNGYLADISSDSTNRVSTVYESETDKVAAGFRATARLASQTITRVRVTFCNDTNGIAGDGCSNSSGSSANLAKYISSASLWYGSTKIATMAVTEADRGTSNDIYTFNFSGLNAMIAKDQIGRFYVSVNANGSMDSNDTATANWTTTFTAGGINANSPDGTSDTYPSADIAQTGLKFGKFSANGVKAEINLASSNPTASVVTVQSTSATNNVNLLKFTVKATNSNLTLRKVPVQVTLTGAGADDIINVLNTLKLYRGTDLVDSVDGSAGFDFTAAGPSDGTGACDDSGADKTCTFYFANLSSPANFIAAGTTAEFTVVADLKQVNTNYTEGDTISASLVSVDLVDSADFSIQDSNGDQLPANSAARVGSAIGYVMTLRVNGVQIVMGNPSYTIVDDAGAIKQVTYIIPVTATAFGNTLYIGQTVLNAAVGAGDNAFSYTLIGSNGTSYNGGVCGGSCSATLETSDAATEGSAYRLDSGAAKHFTIKVTLVTPPVNDISYRVRLNDVRTHPTSALGAGTNQALLPVESYQTGFQLINN